MSYESEVLADSPLGFWQLNEERPSTTMIDSSGNSRNGSVSALSLPFPSLDGLGLDVLNGTGSVASGSWMNTGSMSVEVIHTFANLAGYQQLVDRDGSRRCWSLRTISGKAQFLFWTTAGGPYFANGSTTLVTNVGYHLVGTYDGVTARVYVNGVLDGSYSPSPAAPMQTGSQALNLSGGSGYSSNMAVYGAALSGARIAAHAAEAFITAGDILPWQATGWSYNDLRTASPPSGWAAKGFDDSGWPTGRAAFGGNALGNPGGCAAQSTINTSWAAQGSGDSGEVSLLTRHTFTTDTALRLAVEGSVDNDAELWVDGVRILERVVHDGCPVLPDIRVGVSVNAGTHVIAIRAWDRGLECFSDWRVRPVRNVPPIIENHTGWHVGRVVW